MVDPVNHQLASVCQEWSVVIVFQDIVVTDVKVRESFLKYTSGCLIFALKDDF